MGDASIVNKTGSIIFVLQPRSNNQFAIVSVRPNEQADNVEAVIQPNAQGQVTLDSRCIRLPSAPLYDPIFIITGNPIDVQGGEALIWAANAADKNGRRYGEITTLETRMNMEPSFRNLTNYTMRDLENPRLRSDASVENDISNTLAAILPNLSPKISPAQSTNEITLTTNLPTSISQDGFSRNT